MQSDELDEVIKQKANKLENDIETLVQRSMQASNQRVITAYEENIESLENQKLVLLENYKIRLNLHTPFRNCLNFP